jgi:hypothetical protein
MTEVIVFTVCAAMAGGCLHGLLNRKGDVVEAFGLLISVALCLLILVN